MSEMGEGLRSVPEVDKISFSDEEVKVLELWKTMDVFQTCLKQSKGRPRLESQAAIIFFLCSLIWNNSNEMFSLLSD